MELTRIDIDGGLFMVHNHTHDAFYISPDDTHRVSPTGVFRIQSKRNWRLIKGKILDRIVVDHNDELFTVFSDISLSEKERATQIKGIILEWYTFYEKEEQRTAAFTQANDAERKIRTAQEAWKNPIKDEAGFQEEIAIYVQRAAQPSEAYSKVKPEEIAAIRIANSGYLNHAINEFMNLKHRRGFFLWMHKQTRIYKYQQDPTYIPDPNVLNYNSAGLEMARHLIGKQMLEIIKTTILSSAYDRSDRRRLLRFYIEGGMNDTPKEKGLFINAPSIKADYDNIMGRGRWHTRAGKKQKVVERVKGKCKPIGELRYKDGVEESMRRYAMRGELSAYDPNIKSKRLGDMVARIMQIRVAYRQHIDPQKIKEAFGYATIQDAIAEYVKMRDTETVSLVNWLFFHKAPGTNRSNLVHRLDRMWQQANYEQELLEIEEWLYDVLFHCPECGHKFIPPIKFWLSKEIQCFKCKHKGEYPSFQWSGKENGWSRPYELYAPDLPKGSKLCLPSVKTVRGRGRKWIQRPGNHLDGESMLVGLIDSMYRPKN